MQDAALSHGAEGFGAGIAVEPGPGGLLTLLLAGTSLTAAVLDALDRALDRLEALAGPEDGRALVIRSRQPGAFLPGFAPEELVSLADGDAARAFAQRGQHVFRRLELLPIPTVAAIDGICTGCGAELALACSYRVASDSPRTRIGFPDLRLGLAPGLGGTVRLPRLLGAQGALELLLSGEALDAGAAERVGLVDAVLDAEHFAERVEAFITARLAHGRRRTGTRRRMSRRLLEDTAPGRRVVFRRAARLRETGAAPAVERLVDAVSEGLMLPLDRAFEREAGIFGQLAASGEARARLHAARVIDEANRVQRGSESLAQAAVLGAGEMGSEFADLLSRAGVAVRLKDRKRGAIGAAVHAAAERLRRLGDGPGHDPVEMLSGAPGFGGFGIVDLVVACVGDRGEVVRFALREAAEHTREVCLLAASSPVVSIAALQADIPHPERVLGLHAVLPSNLFPVIEVVPGAGTSESAVEAGLALARRMGRTPLRTADRPGHLIGRLLAALFAEAMRLVDEGATITAVDAALQEHGWLLGPFRRMDLMGPARVARQMEAVAAALGPRLRPGTVLGRLRGAEDTFYRYRRGDPVAPNTALPAGLRGLGPEHHALMLERMEMLVLKEAALLLEERTAGPRDVEVASLLGLGYPVVRGGLLYHADHTGITRVVTRMEDLVRRFGERFAPAPLLQRTAAAGTRLAPHSGQAPDGVL
jgi:3-hydroxyacyl-CoA dehydrogenase/enoyl-CoA hydratase/3-hydroxybutyryl-CoA epimerase